MRPLVCRDTDTPCSANGADRIVGAVTAALESVTQQLELGLE